MGGDVRMRFEGPIYIAGPMRDIPEKNRPMFDKVAATVRSIGYAVYNPADLEDSYPETATYTDYLRGALRMLLLCKSVILLPGWEDSYGANIEKELAEQLGMECYEWAEPTPESLPGVEIWSEGGTTAYVSGVDTRAATGITDGVGGYATVTPIARATGSPSVEPATPGHTPTP